MSKINQKNNNEEKVSKNMSVFTVLKNWYEVQKQTIAYQVDRTGCKISNSSYAVDLHMPRKTGAGYTSVDIYEDAKESAVSLIGVDAYNRIKQIVSDKCADFYKDNDQARVDEITSAIAIALHNDVVMYAMLCALFRVQTGWMKTDNQNTYLAPILFNHDAKGLSQADWEVGGSNSFTEEIQVSDARTPSQVRALNQVWGLVNIGNNDWNDIVSNVVNNINIPSNLRKMIEHLFTKVFIDPACGYNTSTVTLFPSSLVLKMDFDNENTQYKINEVKSLTGYDSYYTKGAWLQSIDQDNTSTYQNIVDYFELVALNKSELINGFSVVKHVYEALGWTSGSDFDFTRDRYKKTITYVTEENVRDFVQSTAYNYQNAESASYGDAAYKLVATALPFTVRDEEISRYSRTAQYVGEVTMGLAGSFEFACKGRLHPLRFAYHSIDNDAKYGTYRYHFLVPSTVSDIGTEDGKFTEAQVTSLQYINAELTDFGAIVPLQNDHYSGKLANGMGAPDMSVIASTNCYYTSGENLKLYINTALELLLQ